MATFYSNNYGGRQLRLEVWQDGGYLKWALYSEGNSGTLTINETTVLSMDGYDYVYTSNANTIVDALLKYVSG